MFKTSPNMCYGAPVTNYSVNGISNFKVFHFDEENIYLISSDYIPPDKIPSTKGGVKLENTNSKYSKVAPLTNAVDDMFYSYGSGSISRKNPARKWLASYLDKYTSINDNMKAVAYMLDTSVWNTFKGEEAEYAIGGPTIDMLFASYNKKYRKNYIGKAMCTYGYKVIEEGKEDEILCHIGMLNAKDSLYVLPESRGALACWIASPSACDASDVVRVDCNGNFYSNSYSTCSIGFRPVICLKSNISLIRNDDGSIALN